MAAAEQLALPSELVGATLCRLPIKSLARFKAVCKQWNAIWEDNCFFDKYLASARPQFILRTESQMYTIDMINVNEIELREINLGIPCGRHTSLVHCDGFLLSGFVVWNPWLRQTRRILSQKQEFRFCGIGYDNSRGEKRYKIFGYGFGFDASLQLLPKVAIYDCKSDACKFINPPREDWRVPHLDGIVSMNGNLYWIAYNSEAREYFIRSFDFREEIFKTFCLLPCNEDLGYTQVLGVFRRDQLSVLRQSYITSNIEILVTKKKIDGDGEAVAWITFMTVSIPDFPRLQHKYLDPQPSYFVDNIDNKRLFVCTCDESGRACIYIVKGDVFTKIPIDYVVDLWPSHHTYIPSLIPVPSCHKEQQVLQV